MDKLEIEYNYICPDCGIGHDEEHHPPYCSACILEVTL